MPIPYPSDLTFERWASEFVALAFDSGIEIPLPPRESEWREWTDRLRELDELDVPLHNDFQSWQAWAERFVQLNDDVIG